MINFYTIYRLVLFTITLGGIVNLIVKIKKYKQYYNKIPQSMKIYLLKQGGTILAGKLRETQQDLLINGLLLVVLITLNIFLFVY